MRMSSDGIELLKEHEGVRKEVYLDPIGLPTGGVGHLLKGDEIQRFPVGTQLSDEQIDEWLRQDIREAEEAVERLVQVKLNQNQFDALVSFVFNVGSGNFQKSQLLRLINADRVNLAAQEFNRWVYAGGRRFRGLERRRADEAELFKGGTDNAA